MSSENSKLPLCVYIDGFNLYHAVCVYDDPRLKWLNFRTLAESFCRPNEFLGDVYFFTAVATWDREKEQRHRNFIAAQKAIGVKVIESKFKRSRKLCLSTGNYCKHYEEKQTDVAIATTLMSDAVKQRVSRAILVTADSDQIPLAKAMKEAFPEVALTLAAPPGRAGMARELGDEILDRKPVTLERLHAHHLPRHVLDATGKIIATRPEYYGIDAA